jgi:predicted nucleotidyltransferase
MKTIEDIRAFLDPLIAWASDQPDVQGVALVGSYARGEAREDSDIDLVILTGRPQTYLDDPRWIERFGEAQRTQVEDYGRLQSIRVWYRNGVEVEYGITQPDWASMPLDPGTREVIRGGMIVLFERGTLLSRHSKI